MVSPELKCARGTAMKDDHSIVERFLDRRNVIAVIGVSTDSAKYGNRVFFDLLDGGYKTYAVHPDGGTVGEHTRYPDLDSLPERPDVVDTVVPPMVTEQVVRECHRLGISKIWMQPGSESPAAIEFCNQHGIDVLHDVCIMVERSRS